VRIRKVFQEKRVLHEEPLFPMILWHFLPFLNAALPPPDQTSPCGYAPLTVPRVFAAVLSTTGRHQKELSAAQGRKQSNIDFLPYLSTRCRKEIYKRDVLPRCVSSEPLVV